MAQHEEAIFYNPANFETQENLAIECSYNRFYLSMQSVSLSIGKKIKNIDFGIGIVNYDYGEIEWRPNYPTEDPLISYSAYDFTLILGAGINLSPNGRFGLNLKYVTENLYVYSDYALAADVAFSYRTPSNGISFGATNFGTKMTLNNGEVNLPARLSLGGYQMVKTITLSGDLHYLVNEAAFEFGLGASMPIHRRVSISAAALYREGFYPGFGIIVDTGIMEVKYGGSFYPKDLGMVNNISIGFGL
ncbi:hypothetical protein KAS45_03770 [candidate division WOR-3 bacterium]|nr:hypothetical protein [candidate division WOR-3 bacterium]